MGIRSYGYRHSFEEESGWLVYLLGFAAGICFFMALSIYCDWPVDRQDVIRWVSVVQARVKGEIELHKNSRSSDAKSELDSRSPWAQVDLQYSLVESFLTEENCKQSRKNLTACVAVVNRLLDYSNVPSEFVPGPSKFWARLLKRQVEDFGFAHVQRHASNLDNDLRRAFEHDRKLRQERELEWERERLLNDPMPFENVARWLKYEIVDPSFESELTAVAYNTYLSVAKDPHSQIVPLVLYKSMFGQTTKQFSGFGLELRRLGDNIYFYDVGDSTPAQRAGLQAYDILNEINDMSVAGMTIKDVITEMRDSETVKLKVSRAGRPLTFHIPKAKNLAMHDVTSTLLGSSEDLMGYIKVTRFASGVCKSVRSALEYFNHNEVTSIVMDLRNNTGGDLSEGVCLTGLFLPKGARIAQVENLTGNNQNRTFQALTDPATQLPLYVLVNARTASASEIFAGAIQQYQRAIIIGTRSFGKGTTQIGRSWSRSAADPISKKFIYLSTIGRFLLPSGESIQIHGVQPDIPVYASPWPTDYDKFAIREEDNLFYIEPTRAPVHHIDDTLMARLTSCKQSQDLATDRYDQLQKAGLLPDYVLISAQYWARCLNHTQGGPTVRTATAFQQQQRQ